MQLALVGAGYVGLVTAACLVRLGHRVRVIDIDAQRVEGLNRGIVPIREPGLDELIDEGLASGRLSFHADVTATHGSRLAIVAVGTLDRAGEWTDRNVLAAAESLARDPDAPRRIVVRSTLLPGTARRIAARLEEIDPTVEFALNPEFTREGSAVNDFLAPDRVVIGSDGGESQPVVTDLVRLYEPLERPIVVTDLASAEMGKMASNVFLATKIAFANELARICAAVDADVLAVAEVLGLDNRIGRSFLSPGPGFGGSCLPSQARVLPGLARDVGASVPVMASVAESNARQASWIVETVERGIGELDGRRVALLGLSFKAGTDDVRESPALTIAQRLVERGATVAAYDPHADRAAVLAAVPDITIVDDVESACRDAEAVVVATEWPEFHGIDWLALAPLMRGSLVVDARHIVDGPMAEEAGLHVDSLGRPSRAGRRPLAHATSG